MFLQRIVPALLFAICCMASACEDNSPDKPLPKEKMQQVLLDISIAESYSTMVKDSLHKQGQKNPDSLAQYYKDIFAHHKITYEQYKSSLKWYKDHPDDMDTLFNNILPVVTRWQATGK